MFVTIPSFSNPRQVTLKLNETQKPFFKTLRNDIMKHYVEDIV